MTLNQAVELVFFAFSNGENGDILVQKSPSSTMEIFTKSLLKSVNKPNYKVGHIGIRHGEKLYEVLLSKEEKAVANDLGNYFRVPADNRDLNYDKYFTEGTFEYKNATEYNSNNTTQLNEEEVVDILSNLPLIKNLIKLVYQERFLNITITGSNGFIGSNLYLNLEDDKSIENIQDNIRINRIRN